MSEIRFSSWHDIHERLDRIQMSFSKNMWDFLNFAKKHEIGPDTKRELENKRKEEQENDSTEQGKQTNKAKSGKKTQKERTERAQRRRGLRTATDKQKEYTAQIFADLNVGY